jgi:hypothetical protein
MISSHLALVFFASPEIESHERDIEVNARKKWHGAATKGHRLHGDVSSATKNHKP